MLHRITYLALWGFCFLLLAQSGCQSGLGNIGNVRSLFANRVSVHVSLPPEGNERTAVAVDFLIIHNQELAEKLMGFDARTWFMAKNQIKNDFTLGKDFEIEEREYAPGSVVQAVELPWSNRRIVNNRDNRRNNNTVLLIFADYLSPGPHRFRTTQRQEWTLTLHEKEFRVVPKN